MVEESCIVDIGRPRSKAEYTYSTFSSFLDSKVSTSEPRNRDRLAQVANQCSQAGIGGDHLRCQSFLLEKSLYIYTSACSFTTASQSHRSPLWSRRLGRTVEGSCLRSQTAALTAHCSACRWLGNELSSRVFRCGRRVRRVV